MAKLLGNRIFLEIPKTEESKLIVDENTKEALEKEMIKKMSRLTVHSVGTAIMDIKQGDVVLVDPEALSITGLGALGFVCSAGVATAGDSTYFL